MVSEKQIKRLENYGMLYYDNHNGRYFKCLRCKDCIDVDDDTKYKEIKNHSFECESKCKIVKIDNICEHEITEKIEEYRGYIYLKEYVPKELVFHILTLIEDTITECKKINYMPEIMFLTQYKRPDETCQSNATIYGMNGRWEEVYTNLIDSCDYFKKVSNTYKNKKRLI